nr:hypothetical protein [Tanacetum cinerariifolium]
MKTKDSLSSCSNLEEQEIQQLQKQAKNSKENSLNKLNTLRSTIQHLSSSNYSMYNKFRDAFQRIFEADERTFKSVLSRNMQNFERKLHKETFHEKDSNSDLRVIKVQFEQFIHLKVLEPSNYNSYDLETRRDFKEYTQMEAQTFKETITQNMNSIEQCIIKRENHEQVLLNGLKSKSRNECNDKSTSEDDTDIRPSYDTEPMVEVPYTAEYNVFVVDTQHSEQPECINNTCVLETSDSNVFPDSLDVCDNDIQNDQNVVECDDEQEAKKGTTSKDKVLNTKPSVKQSARLPNTANGNKPKPRNFNQQPRNWPPSMSSRVSNRTDNIAEPPGNQKSFLKIKDLECPTCKQFIFSANHDECILQYISELNSHASIPIGQKFSPNKSSIVYLKTMPTRSSLTWKPTGRIFTQVGLNWIPIRKFVETRYNMNNSASPLGKETHNPKTVICANSSSLSVEVNHKPTGSRPPLKSNQSRDKVLPNNSQVKAKNTQVEVHPRIPSVLDKMKSVTVCKDSLNSRTLNANANAVCATCNKCLVDSNHFACVTKMLNDVHARTKNPN